MIILKLTGIGLDNHTATCW